MIIIFGIAAVVYSSFFAFCVRYHFKKFGLFNNFLLLGAGGLVFGVQFGLLFLSLWAFNGFSL